MARSDDCIGIKELAATMQRALTACPTSLHKSAATRTMQEFLAAYREDRDLLRSFENFINNPIDAKRKATDILQRHRDLYLRFGMESTAGAVKMLNFEYLKEIIGPAVRTSASREGLDYAWDNGLFFYLDFDSFSIEEKVLVFRLMGEQMHVSYVKQDLDVRFLVAVFELVCGREISLLRVRSNRRKMTMVAVESEFLMAILRIITAPLPESLPKAKKQLMYNIKNEWSHLLAMFVTILIGEMGTLDAGKWIRQAEAQILLAKPWVWKSLEQMGSEYIANADDPFEPGCKDSVLWHALCGVSVKVYKSAVAAGGDEAFTKILRRSYSLDPDGKLEDSIKEALNVFHLAAKPGALATWAAASSSDGQR